MTTRVLTLTSPHMKGDDVVRLQKAAGVHPVDGDYGPDTHHTVLAKAKRLGVSPVSGSVKAAKRRVKVILGARRTPAEILRARTVKKAAATSSTGLAAALKWAKSQVGVSESPAGSNRGAKVTQWLAAVGIPGGGAPWCGAFAHAVAKVYGLDLTDDVRYCPAIRGHAQSGTGGFASWTTSRSVANKALKSGRLVLVVYDFGGSIAEHVGVAADLSSTTVHDFEGNTTTQGKSGSQSNGGIVAYRTDRADSLVQGYAICRAAA